MKHLVESTVITRSVQTPAIILGLRPKPRRFSLAIAQPNPARLPLSPDGDSFLGKNLPLKAFKLRYLSAPRSMPAVQPKRPYVVLRAPRNIGGSATFFLLRCLWRLHCHGDGCDRHESPGALAGQEKVVV